MRLPNEASDTLETGPAIEKSVAAVKCFVSEPMRYGSLFLCGDAAHIVPPTGAKGLNLAASDVHYLFESLACHYLHGDPGGLEKYSDKALARVWKAMRFSGWMTGMLHKFTNHTPFDEKIQESELNYIAESETGKRMLAENYIGLPY